MDRLYKLKLADAVSPHTSGNSARPPMDQCNYERNTSGLSFLCDYAPLCCNEMGAIFLNPAAFGELVVIVRHIEAEPVVVQFWSDIHPRIVNVSHDLYVDGHYSTAAEKAVKEVESRLREKFLELKTGAAVPAKIGDVIGALMSENGAFKFCDTTTTSGKDYRRGIHSLFEGIMAAYRNPAAHANLQYEKREAMEQIMLASQLMYVLDKPQL
mgnify:CR=1 FL=1